MFMFSLHTDINQPSASSHAGVHAVADPRALCMVKYVAINIIYHTGTLGPAAQLQLLLTPCRHAGEINTLQGNLNWMSSREHSLKNEVWHGREEELLPVCNSAESDSANLDHVAEIMMRTGVDPCEALMVLVPEAYHNHPELQKHYPEVCQACRLLRGCTVRGAFG